MRLVIPLAILVLIGSLVIPLAPFLPGLNRLPLVGSPKLHVVFRLNGRRDLTLTTTPGDAHACVLEVEVTNPSRWFAVKDAWVNFLIPSGLKIGRCDQFGQPERGGNWEDFHAHKLGSHSRADYWYDTDLEFPPRLTKRFRIKLQLGVGDEGEQLEYPILFKLAAPSLYNLVQRQGVIVVRDGSPSLADRMGKVITTAEQGLDELESLPPFGQHEGDRRRIAMSVAAAAVEVLNPAIADNPLPQTPEDASASSHQYHVLMHIRALYVVRNELGRAAS
jgi:hypothetical protein